MSVKITRKSITAATKYVKAAGEDEDDLAGMDLEDADGVMDALDDVADDVEEIQDGLDDMEDDSVDIALNNNITNHYIAECEKCQGIFISAVIESDQEIDHVSGICPMCGRETDQYLKWVIRDIDSDEGAAE